MDSFNDVLDEIKTILEGDTALQDFCNTKFNKSMTVKRVFKRRTEISRSDLPITLITSPENKPGRRTQASREYTRIVRFYCGFSKNDRDQAQEIVVELEEIIEDALLSYFRAGSFPAGVSDINPGDSVNDEGYAHPDYFIVKDATVDFER